MNLFNINIAFKIYYKGDVNMFEEYEDYGFHGITTNPRKLTKMMKENEYEEQREKSFWEL
jgi:hypothetical protein